MNAFNADARDLPTVEMAKRHFSIDESNRALVLVRRIVSDVMHGYQQVLDHQEILEVHRTGGAEEQAGNVQQEIVSLVERLQACADELLVIGAEIRDWSTGLVDFPALDGGREIMLCWQYGEQDVRFWHQSDEGCESRRDVRSLQPVT